MTHPTAGSQRPDPLGVELREVAVQVATAAAELVARRRAEVLGSGTVRTKTSGTDPVTLADTESEQLIRSELGRLRPGDAVLGEEEGGDAAVDGLRWLIDPIDGTVNFLYGLPFYAVSVAVQRDGQSIAGAVVEVSSGRVFSAALGAGATLDGQPLRCNDVTDPALALVATGFGYQARRRVTQGAVVAELLPQVRDVRRVGSAALDLCAVAAGWLDAYYEHGLSPWDWGAGVLIAAEAGADVRPPPATAPGSHGELTFAAAPGVSAAVLSLVERAWSGPMP
ncbi:inositol monophosphatase family protein [Rhodococcus sp. X156]|uniref:inositol monophosphatase family protein n=1 Tax=Rhodococcus sp. X156 TaxID=2499145 RepID=UPI000FD891B2|nr:inositol monophosphatase family protein [Rhodococcus sp. X156]